MSKSNSGIRQVIVSSHSRSKPYQTDCLVHTVFIILDIFLFVDWTWSSHYLMMLSQVRHHASWGSGCRVQALPTGRLLKRLNMHPDTT